MLPVIRWRRDPPPVQPDAAAPAQPDAAAPAQPDAAAPAQPDAAAPAPWQARRARAVAGLRRHWLISVLLAAGLTLRVLTQVAYQPALIYVDSLKYLYGTSPGSEPLGYAGMLRLIMPAGGLATVAAIQHLLGLAMAVVLYAVLLRRGASRWLAAVAAAPVLLDGYQLQMEQMIMSDVCFEAMIVAGLAVLAWRPAVNVRIAVAAGLILGSSATVRQVGEILVAPAVAYLLAADGNWRRAVRTSAALAAAFAVPILCYCGISAARTGHFWLARRQSIAGRLMAAADCATLKLPAAARPLCPTPAEQAHGPDWLEKSVQSPLYRPLPPGTNRGTGKSELLSAVLHQQPLRVAASILRDSVRLFAVTRQNAESVTPLWRWQFQTSYPVYPKWVNLGPGNTIVLGLQRRAFGPFHYITDGRARVYRPVAAFLRGYQTSIGYTPGPVYALAALAGLAGSLLALGRRAGPRARQLALACLLFTAAAAALLLVPDIFEYSWRYELSAVVTLAPAGGLGLSALLSRRQPDGRR